MNIPKLIINFLILLCLSDSYTIKKNSHGLRVQAVFKKKKIFSRQKSFNGIDRNENQFEDSQNTRDLYEKNCSKKIVGYYTEWTAYTLLPSKIAFDKLIHINYVT